MSFFLCPSQGLYYPCLLWATVCKWHLRHSQGWVGHNTALTLQTVLWATSPWVLLCERRESNEVISSLAIGLLSFFACYKNDWSTGNQRREKRILPARDGYLQQFGKYPSDTFLCRLYNPYTFLKPQGPPFNSSQGHQPCRCNPRFPAYLCPRAPQPLQVEHLCPPGGRCSQEAERRDYPTGQPWICGAWI